MTWIDIADSAVKIGLGALIAGASGFASAKLTHDRGARAEYTKRRRDLLEKVLEMMNRFDRAYRHQKALYDTLVQQLTPEEITACKNDFEQLDEQLRIAFEGFADASGILLMLGETHAEYALDEYRTAANCWYEEGIPDLSVMPPARAEQLREKIADKRGVVMAKLAEAYKDL